MGRKPTAPADVVRLSREQIVGRQGQTIGAEYSQLQMSATASQPDVDYTGLTENTPQTGCVTLAGGVALSAADRWFEDGQHVIRSLEFDLVAEDPDPSRVVDVFVESAQDLGVALLELGARGEATEHETETLALLSQRLFTAAQFLEREQDRRRIQIRLRLRGHHSGQWRQQTRPATSTKLSYA